MNLKQLLKRTVDSNLPDRKVILKNVLASQNEVKRSAPVRGFLRPAVAAAIILAVILSISVTAIAINANKQASLVLNAVGSSEFPVIRKNDVVTVTASVANQRLLRDGVYGFTMDVTYDNNKFSFVDDSLELKASDPNFSVSANADVPGTVTVLFYADNPTGALSVIAGNSALFSLKFDVLADVTYANSFTPSDCKFADRKDSGTGFELITLDPVPTALNVTTKKVEAGDINGDGSVTVSDMISLKRHIVGYSLTGGALLAADTTGQGGEPGTTDIIWMKKKSLGLLP